MSIAVKDLRSLPLFEIIGAPLVAVVQAETQAMRATVEYIQRVGFSEPGDSAKDNFGKLRMAEFRYVKPDASGMPAEFLAQVPVLSLVPIPGVRVKTAKISFAAKITDVYSEETGSGSASKSISRDSEVVASARLGQWLKPTITQFRGSLAPAPRKTTDQVRGSYELNIEIELEQMPIAPGLEKLLHTLDQAISDEERAKENK